MTIRDHLDDQFARQFGPTPKQAWWAGYRAGKGLPPDTPRREAINWPKPTDPIPPTQGEPDVQA